MTLLTEAVIFAARMHDGAVRRGTRVPYIVHPMEVAAIASTLTQDEEVLAAAVLHDVVEDCGQTLQGVAERFGARVAALVEAETQTPRPDPETSWLARKEEALFKLAHGGRDARLIALADKLSNMRAIARDYAQSGEAVFSRFHERDKRLLAWYYRSCAALTREAFGGTDAWRELDGLVASVFAGVENPDGIPRQFG